MLTFSTKGLKRRAGEESGQFYIYVMSEKGEDFFCTYRTWPFGSCAAAEINFRNVYMTITKEQIDDFIKWLSTDPFNEHTVQSNYYQNSKEVYFLLGETQIVGSRFKELINHPNVRCVDSYNNKSHSPHSLVKLFRLSVKGDFPK